AAGGELRLLPDDQPLHRALDVQLPRTDVVRAGGDPAAGPVHRLSAQRADAVPPPGAGLMALFGGFVMPSRLRSLGVLGMNSRNANYIAHHNPRHLYPLVDNKLKTKKACHRAGIATPKLLGYIETQGEVKRLMRRLAN